jgi:hypothetical protein
VLELDNGIAVSQWSTVYGKSGTTTVTNAGKATARSRCRARDQVKPWAMITTSGVALTDSW